MKAEAEIGGMCPQAKRCHVARSPQKPADRCGTESPTDLPEESNPANTLASDFWPPELLEHTFL